MEFYMRCSTVVGSNSQKQTICLLFPVCPGKFGQILLWLYRVIVLYTGMRKYAKDTTEQVIDTLSSNLRQGLSSIQVASLKKEHGLNKLEEEEKVWLYCYIFFAVYIFLLKWEFLMIHRSILFYGILDNLKTLSSCCC